MSLEVDPREVALLFPFESKLLMKSSKKLSALSDGCYQKRKVEVNEYHVRQRANNVSLVSYHLMQKKYSRKQENVQQRPKHHELCTINHAPTVNHAVKQTSNDNLSQ